MDIFAQMLSRGKKCPDCGRPLVPEESVPEGMVSKAAWDSVYESVFLVRRGRLICMNQKCKSYYKRTYHKFIVNLLGQVVDEHFMDDALRKNRKK